MKITYFGHSAFQIETNGKFILFDPFIKNNPLTQKDINDIKADYILVSHGHQDHFGDTIEIAKKTNATLIVIYEMGVYLKEKCNIKNIHTMNIGGFYNIEFGKIKMVNALHSSSIIENQNIISLGNPCGFILEIEGKILYFAGDTGIFSEMEIYGKLHKIDYAFLPIGSNYTMDTDEALLAAKLLNVDNIIPMHYNTFDLIKVDLKEFEKKISTEGKKLIIIQPDSAIEI